MSVRGERPAHGISSNPTLVGAAILLGVVLTVFLSYNANKGLPYVPTVKAYAEVPDAAELVRGSEVRIGGARVGQVIAVEAMPSENGRAPLARLELKLNQDLKDVIPVDTVVQIRPRSILGAKYVDLTFGESREILADGGTLELDNALPTPELDEAFNTFDPETSRGLRDAIVVIGDSVAGRGSAINDTIVNSRRLLPPLQRVLGVLGAESTDLEGFVAGAASLTGTLAPRARQLGSLIDSAAVTLQAIDAAGDSLGRSIDGLAATEVTGIRALRAAQPVLEDAAALTRELRPGARRLPAATGALADALEAGTPVLRRTPRLAGDLRATLAALGALARLPATPGAVRKLLATVESVNETLPTLLPAQVVCNYNGLYARNLASVPLEGDAAGSWINLILILEQSEIRQEAEASPNLHLNHSPVASAQECEAGNEPFAPGRQIGNPAGIQPNRTEATRPPAGVRERARAAGLLDEFPESAR